MPKEKKVHTPKIDRTTLLFLKLLEDRGLPFPQLEYKFHKDRKWRADYAWPQHGVILEVEGAIWAMGRHTRGSGFIKDMEKYNAAALLGFKLLRVTPQALCTAKTIEMIEKILSKQELNNN